MKGASIFFFITVMWILIIAGGGILIHILAPISITGFGKFDKIIDSVAKAGIAMVLVLIWVLLMSKIKNWIFHKQING